MPTFWQRGAGRVVIVGHGLVVILGITTVGVLMAVSMLLLPAVAAHLLPATTSRMPLLSVLLGTVAGFAGLLVSYHADLPTGPTLALVAAVQVLLAAAARRPPAALRRTVLPDLAGHA